VTQESLRTQVSVVTQDTSLLHRSIRDNIRLRQGPTPAKPTSSARRQMATRMTSSSTSKINSARRGYDAHVARRGVKLSGGHASASPSPRHPEGRADSVLDEATSALDSEG